MSSVIHVREVRSSSVQAETLWVARAGMAILLVSSFAIFAQRGASVEGAASPLLQPYQRLFADLDAPTQRMVRSLREAMLEAEQAREKTGRWPPVDQLAADGIPPFASDPIDSAGYRWGQAHEGLYVSYRGAAVVGAARPELMLLFIEPDSKALRMPGEKPPPVDEQHHTLLDGTALHVSIWMRLPGPTSDPAPVSAFPAASGWTQVLSKPADPTL
jgi:hypothetical protein